MNQQDYERYARDLYEAGEFLKLVQFGQPGDCACLGKRDGNDLCPCRMRQRAASSQFAMVEVRKKAGHHPTGYGVPR